MRVNKSAFEESLLDLIQNESLIIAQNALIRCKIEKNTACAEEYVKLVKNENKLKQLEKIPSHLTTAQSEILFAIAKTEFRGKKGIILALSQKYYKCRTLIYSEYHNSILLLSTIMEL